LEAYLRLALLAQSGTRAGPLLCMESESAARDKSRRVLAVEEALALAIGSV
jgi:hypothetical protein